MMMNAIQLFIDGEQAVTPFVTSDLSNDNVLRLDRSGFAFNLSLIEVDGIPFLDARFLTNPELADEQKLSIPYQEANAVRIVRTASRFFNRHNAVAGFPFAADFDTQYGVPVMGDAFGGSRNEVEPTHQFFLANHPDANSFILNETNDVLLTEDGEPLLL